jgi:D-arabinonate dehydratase
VRIEAIDVIPLKLPLPRVYKGSHYQMTHRCTVITRVRTDDGIVGEAYNGDEFERQAELCRIIRDELTPLVTGMDAFNVEGCWQAMQPPTYDVLRDRKLTVEAIACVDSAIWDAIGKALNAPLYRLWGGYRDELPVVAIGGYYDPAKKPADYGQEMAAFKADGLAGCKFKVGGRSPEEDAARVRAVREATGDDFILAVDANQAWTTREALRFAGLVGDLNIRWFEEPCRWVNDRRAMRDVRAISGVPVCAGQSEIDRNGCRDLMMDGAIDVCNFDSSWGGGPTEWRRVAALASCFDVQMAHHEEPQVAAQLLAAYPHGTYLEVFHRERDPLFYELVANRSPIKDGRYRVPQGPGWGLVLDHAVINRFRQD